MIIVPPFNSISNDLYYFWKLLHIKDVIINIKDANSFQKIKKKIKPLL